MEFCIVGKIAGVETIVEGNGIRELALLRQRYRVGYWRKKKGIASMRLLDGTTVRAELPGYQAHGIGKVIKLKRKDWL